MAKKNGDYYKKKLDEIKDEKRALGQSIPSSVYGQVGLTNQEKKKIKEGLKAARRALKHSENFEIQKHIDEELEKFKKK